ncbi:PspC domain-containing protein [Nocardioides euryhalodurans]|nr:PspC domain-containing protein [Nocardioides euryhalodurans]
MTTTPPEAPIDEGPRTTRDEIRDLGRLRRTVGDRKVAGVAGGLARHLDIDPVILRVAFVVLAFFGGAGLILYAAGWALVPEEGRERAAVHLDERSRTVALVALAVIAALALVGDSWGAYWFPWPLAILGLIVFVWLSRSNRSDADEAGPVHAGTGDDAYGPYDAGSPPPATWASAPVAPRPRDPRKRGPLLFWFTLALLAFALGVLGIVDLAGVAVADSAYPALAVGVIGTMLVVGSVIGRAGGLILLGLVASTALVGATLADRWEGEQIYAAPVTADGVGEDYSMTTGELVVDLTDVRDPEQLDGRTIAVSGEAGRIEVIVPEEMDVQVEADVDGPGGYDLFGSEGGGIDWTQQASHDGGPDAPEVTIDARLSVGEITVTTE